MNAEAGVGSGVAGPEPGTPGELLRTQRERRALSVQQAAEDLHLDTWAIEAIEANRFLALGAPVYAKGHLRKYASLLGLSPEMVIARYEALHDTPAEPTPIPVAAPTRAERKPFRVPLWVFLALLVGVLGWLVFELLRPPPPQENQVFTAAPVAEIPPAPQPEAGQVEAGPTTAAAIAPAAPAATQPPPTVVAPPIRIRLEFSEPSWTEVYDANGVRLMYDTGLPERVRNLTGVPPLRVTLGVAGAVSLQMGDRPIEIPHRDGRKSSKFFVEADGTARLEGSAPTTVRAQDVR